MSFRRSVLGIGLAALLAVSVASPAFAYGKENYQATFAGTGVTPGSGSFGFWGWCAFGGGTTAGNTGNCEFAEYVHPAGGGGFTCHESLDITSWTINGDFIVSGTVAVTPTSLTQACLSIFPGGFNPTTTLSGVDSGIPGKPGHYNLGSIFGAHGEFQIQVTQVA